ncbi:MAG: MBL fold metallo-hydrolase RNA specificity domain-containing protein [Cyclobacteriaceae bacterium]
MDVRVKFLGAAKSVTGSKYLLEIDDFKLIIDCGLFQGKKELRRRNWDDLPQNSDDIDAMVITHSHIDHIGYLPRLIKQGFNGPIYCTSATKDLMEIMLKDSAKIQEEEAAFAKRKGYSKHKDPQPLYGTEDAEAALLNLKACDYDKNVNVHHTIGVKFYNAGHILGSTLVEVTLHGNEQDKKIVFSGDLGRYDQPVLRDPEVIEEADILFVESTYGNKKNPPVSPKDSLAEVVNETVANGGCLLIPAFALGRTQLLIYYLKQLLEEGKIPDLPVFIDSPMAIKVTALYKKHFNDHKLREEELEDSVFDYKNLRYCKSAQDSKAINDRKKNAIIISASGMCTGGRIIHHLYHRLPREKDTVLFVGYQAEGTRGRRILEQEETIRIFGKDVPLNCQVRHINGLSAHADRSEILRWLGNFKKGPKYTFVVHGEVESATALADSLKQDFQWNAVVPDYLESFQLFSNI